MKNASHSGSRADGLPGRSMLSRHVHGATQGLDRVGWRHALDVILLIAATTFQVYPAMAAELPAYEDEDGNSLKPSISLEGAFFPQSQSWFGESRTNLGDKSDYWFEEVLTLGLDGNLTLDGFGSLYGRASGIAAATQRTDAAGSNVPDDTQEDISWEDAYVGWNSGDLLADSLGSGALDFSYGRQKYEVGSGFLFDDAGSDGRERAAYWIGPHKAFEQAAIARLETGGLLGRAVFLEPNDNPDSDTRLYGVDLQWTEEGLGSAGIGYYHILDSETDTRDGLDVYDVRIDATPLSRVGFLPGLTLKGEFAFEENGDRVEAYGAYGEVGYDFGATVPWRPYVSYRFAHFTGDELDTSSRDENFDPLFYGFNDWGTWLQGEILGEYVLLNQNLNSHTVRLRLSPGDDLTVNLLYYHFSLDEAESFGVSDSDFADELNLIVDYAMNDNLAFSVIGALADPHEGATEFTGGDDVWYYGMLYTILSF